MRILILTQWFSPEPDFKALPFAMELRKMGHEVEVLTGFPNYPFGKLYPGYRIRFLQREDLNGISVVRVPLYPNHDQSALKRIANYLSFAFSAAILGPFVVRRADVIYVYHPPPTIALAAMAIALIQRIPFVYDVQDLWPDTLEATGMVRSPFALRLVGYWCRFVYSKAARITVLSEGFRKRLTQRGVDPMRIEVIPNWCDESQIIPAQCDPAEETLLNGKFNILFAGNMGKAQALKCVIQAAYALQDVHPEIQFVFVGGGVEVEQLKVIGVENKSSNVLFLPWRPAAKVGALLQKANALLVHLKRDPLFEITIPSKIQAYLAIGRPILIGVPGDATDMVQKAGAGIPFIPEDPVSLGKAIEELLALSQADRQQMGDRGRSYYRDFLSIAVGTHRFTRLFKDCLQDAANP